MGAQNRLIQKDDYIKITYFLENLDTKENTLKEDVVVKVSDLDIRLQSEIINSLVGGWFCIELQKVEEERFLKVNTSKYKNIEVGEFVVLNIQNKEEHRLVGKIIKKTTKYTLFDLKTPFEDSNWRVSVEILDTVEEP